MFDLVLKNGFVVDPVNRVHQTFDLGIQHGKIVQVGSDLSTAGLPAERIVELDGKTVIPGGIDAHVHCANPVGPYMVASTGITTIVDYAGPTDTLASHVKGGKACGLNIAVLERLKETEAEGKDISRTEIKRQIDRAMTQGALGIKLLGGHYPLTPRATELAFEIANERRVMIGVHSGSTEHRSDIVGMRESVELARGKPFVLAHINAYCRGKTQSYLQDLEDAFQMLRDNPNIYSDSHLATMNACSGQCNGEEIVDMITVNCMNMFGYPANKAGLQCAMLDGLIRVMAPLEKETVMLEKEEALTYWLSHDTKPMVSFPANIPAVVTACALERRTPGGEFLIDIAATDGGSFPRNNLIHRILCLQRMGYLSLEDVVKKVSTNPARIFGFTNKGHLGEGADADITVLDMERLKPVMSFAKGRKLMQDGVCVGTGGTMLVTREAEKNMKELGLNYDLVDTENSVLYHKAR